MSKLSNQLKQWHKHGLINTEQITAITRFEHDKGHHFSMIRGFIMLGIAVVAIGVIALVAANWFGIPDSVKLGVNFTVLMTIAVAAFYTHHYQMDIAFESLLLAFMLMMMASLGLVTQIYHLNWSWYEAVMTWSLVALPIVLLSHQLANALVWTGLTLIASIFWFMPPSWELISYGNEFPLIMLTIAMCATLTGVTAGQILPRFATTKFIGRACRRWVPFYAMGSVIFADLLISGWHGNDVIMTEEYFVYGVVYLVLALFASYGIYTNKRNSMARRHLIFAMLVGFSALILIVDLAPQSEWLAAATTIFLFTLGAIHYGSLGAARIFQLMTILIGLRFFMVYLVVIGTLAMTGIGLIISGLLIIALAVFWAKISPKMQTWLAGRLS